MGVVKSLTLELFIIGDFLKNPFLQQTNENMTPNYTLKHLKF